MRARFTTFEHDLALIGGQDETRTRQLTWGEFIDHWRRELPEGPLFPRFSTTAHKLVWTPAWTAPSGWSEALWPDFSRTSDPEKARKTPYPLLHMALLDSVDDVERAREAFSFLLACGVSPGFWPGHGATALATACQLGHIPSLAAIMEFGGDIQARLANDAPVREQFKGSNLLHRVGPHLAARTVGSSKRLRERARRALQTLRFLVENMPDPEAPDAQGRNALGMVYQVAPHLESELGPIMARRNAERLAHSLGGSGDVSVDFREHVLANQSWAAKGRAANQGEPIRFEILESSGAGLAGEEGDALPLRPLAPGERTAREVWLRADKIHHAPEGLTASQALLLGRESRAHAVVAGTGESAVWWAFNPRQVRPAICLESAPRPATARTRM